MREEIIDEGVLFSEVSSSFLFLFLPIFKTHLFIKFNCAQKWSVSEHFERVEVVWIFERYF